MGKGDKEARAEAQARLAAERAARKAADRRRSLIMKTSNARRARASKMPRQLE